MTAWWDVVAFYTVVVLLIVGLVNGPRWWRAHRARRLRGPGAPYRGFHGRPIRVTDSLQHEEQGVTEKEGIAVAEALAAHVNLQGTLRTAEAMEAVQRVATNAARERAGYSHRAHMHTPLPETLDRSTFVTGRDYLSRPVPLPRLLYISGPMTGMPDWNYPAFHTCAAFWRARGVDVVSPAESFQGRTDLDYATYIRRDIELLLTCSGIVLLPGWERSGGARIERELAAALGLDILEHGADGTLAVPQHEGGSGWTY